MSKKNAVQDVAAAISGAARGGVAIEQVRRVSVALEISGTAPLIQNCFSQKAIEQMLKKHMGLSVQREKKKPSEVIEAATIRNADGKVVIPVVAIKAAMLSASSSIKTFERKGKLMRTTLFVEGEGAPIEFEAMTPRMDMVRTSGMTRTPDVRFRPMFSNWSARIVIDYDDTLWNVQSIIDLVQRAGRVGVGEWRPEKNGTFGTFRISRHITEASEIEEVRKACGVRLRSLTVPAWALDLDIDPVVMAAALADAEGVEEDESATGT